MVLALLVLAVLAVGYGATRSGTSDATVPQPDARRGPIDARAKTLPATRGCGSTETTDGQPLRTPPVPLIRARRLADRIRIDYQVLARPISCLPVEIIVTANSVDKLGNMAPGEGAGGGRLLLRGRGTVDLKLPPLDLPPYEARAATRTRSGVMSKVTTVPVQESGNYCRQTASAEVCIEGAQRKFERCVRGEAARAACPDYVWRSRPRIPVEPLSAVTLAGLERSFAVRAQLGDTGAVAFQTVVCTRDWSCTATWSGQLGVLRARYVASGYGQRPGCWIAERREILKERNTEGDRWVPLRHQISDRLSACVN